MKELCGKDLFSCGYAHVQKMAVKMKEKRRKQAVLEVRNVIVRVGG